MKYPDWAPQSLIENREKFLGHWGPIAEKFDFKPLPSAKNISQLFDVLLTHPEMEVVWERLGVKDNLPRTDDYPKKQADQIFSVIIQEDSFVDSMPYSERYRLLRSMGNQARQLQQTVEKLRIDKVINPIYQKEKKLSRPKRKLGYEKLSLFDLLENISTLSENYSQITGYLNKTHIDHDVRRSEIFIKIMSCHFKSEYNFYLDKTLATLVSVIFKIEYYEGSIRQKRKSGLDPDNISKEKRRDWPP